MLLANETQSENDPPTIDLTGAPSGRELWQRPKWVVMAWSLVEILLVTNRIQISSRVRIAALRLFGAEIGSDVIFRPSTRIKFPWKLHIGDRSWIGEGVWFHNQDHIYVGSDVVISQETMLTTGSHSHRRDMSLITKPIFIENGAWITSRCLVLGGSRVGKSALAHPMTVINGDVPPNAVVGTSAWTVQGERFKTDKS